MLLWLLRLLCSRPLLLRFDWAAVLLMWLLQLPLPLLLLRWAALLLWLLQLFCSRPLL